VKTKICSKCKKEKELTEFCKDNSRRDGLSAWCRECKKEFMKKYRIKNKEKIKVYNKEYRLEDKEKTKERDKKYHINRRENNLSYNLNGRMKTAIRIALKHNKAGRHWEDLVGYSRQELKQHLEKQFIEGMTWELFMQGKIHIDHYIPQSVYSFTTAEEQDFKNCWGLKNLQPLWASDNLSKHNSLPADFYKEPLPI